MANRGVVAEIARRGYWRESDARILVEAWRSSGETLARFARRHGVERPRLSRWVVRLEGVAGEALRFHPVRLVDQRREPDSGGHGAPIEIQLNGGQRVRVPRGFEAEELRRVLAVLLETAKC